MLLSVFVFWGFLLFWLGIYKGWIFVVVGIGFSIVFIV